MRRRGLDVLLVQPVLSRNPYNQSLQPPLGLVYLATIATMQGHRTQIADFNLKRERPENIIHYLQEQSADVVGVSSYTSSWDDTLRIARLCKHWDSELPVVVGGPHVTLCSSGSATMDERQLLGDWREAVDVLVCGEGEEVFTEILTSYATGRSPSGIPGTIAHTDDGTVFGEQRALIADLDRIPFPDYRLLRCSGTYDDLIVITSRGCPSLCSFCASRVVWGKQYRERSAESVLEEIAFHLRRTMRGLGRDRIVFADDSFLVNAERVAAICRGLASIRGGLRWQCSTRAQDAQDMALLKLMKDCGCTSVFMGIESASGRILDFLQKGTTSDMIVRAVRNIQGAGMRVIGSVMIGLAEESESDVEETLRLLGELQLDHVSCSFVTPLPGTRLYRQYVGKGGGGGKIGNSRDFDFSVPGKYSSTRQKQLHEWQRLATSLTGETAMNG